MKTVIVCWLFDQHAQPCICFTETMFLAIQGNIPDILVLHNFAYVGSQDGDFQVAKDLPRVLVDVRVGRESSEEVLALYGLSWNDIVKKITSLCEDRAEKLKTSVGNRRSHPRSEGAD